jgi:hypothetical protein
MIVMMRLLLMGCSCNSRREDGISIDSFAFAVLDHHVGYLVLDWKLPTRNGTRQGSFHQMHIHQDMVQRRKKLRVGSELVR